MGNIWTSLSKGLPYEWVDRIEKLVRASLLFRLFTYNLNMRASYMMMIQRTTTKSRRRRKPSSNKITSTVEKFMMLLNVRMSGTTA